MAFSTHEKNCKFLNSMDALRRERILCDVTLCVGDSRIWAHKNVLASQSPFFRNLFTSSNGRQPVVQLTDELDAMAVEKIINFCYTGSIDVEIDNIQAILPAACHLQMDEVRGACCAYLEKLLEPSNCLGMKAFAGTLACTDLVNLTDIYIKTNLEKVMDSDEFMLLTKEEVIAMMSDDTISVQSEEQVYQAVMNWVRFDLDSRRCYLSEVLTCVRFSEMSPKFLVSASADSLIKNDAACREVIDQAKDYFLLPPDDRNPVLGPRTGAARKVIKRETLRFEASENSMHSEGERSC